MNKANIKVMDLNLMKVFVAVIENKSASQAAHFLETTQSAVSQDLRKLRQLYNDPLFTRTGRGLKPTLFAQQIYPLVKESLTRLLTSVDMKNSAHADYTGRIVTIGLSDDFEITLGERLIELARGVPNCTRLHFKQANSQVVCEMLLSRAIDLAITAGGFGQEGISFTNIGQSGYGCLVDPETFDSETLDLDTLLSHEHVMVSRSGFFGVVDDVLAARGFRRKVRASTSHFSALPYLLAGTNCISILPDHAAKSIAKVAKLKYFPTPIDFPRYSVGLAWRNFSRSDRVINDMVKICQKELADSIA